MCVALSGCANVETAGPAETTRGWYQAIAALDLVRVKSLTCAADNTAIDEALAPSGGVSRDVDLSGLRPRVDIDLSGLSFVENGSTADRAVVRVTGSLSGQQVAQDVHLVNQDGAWRVCTSGN